MWGCDDGVGVGVGDMKDVVGLEGNLQHQSAFICYFKTVLLDRLLLLLMRVLLLLIHQYQHHPY